MELLGGAHFAVAGAGESHGPGIVTIVHGCPAGLRLRRKAVQGYLDRRRPGSSKLGTPRQEGDRVVLLAGLYDEDHERLLAGGTVAAATDGQALEVPTYEEGYTTGEPIAALVLSAAKRSADYRQFAGPQGEVRPGHTDLVKHHKSQGFADPRGGGRSSYRSTISDVIGGAVARLYLQEHFGTAFLSSICQVGELKAAASLAGAIDELRRAQQGGRLAAGEVRALQDRLDGVPIRSLDAEFAARAADHIAATRKAGDSVGAAVEVVGVNVPPLVGEPLYESLKLRLMGSLGGLNAAQSCEMGAGLDAVPRLGSQNNDAIRRSGYQGNHHGGILGGMTTGNPLVFRVGFKPTSTISLPQDSVRKDLTEIQFRLRKGRHDPCVGVRAGIALESRMAIEVMDAVLAHQSGRLHAGDFNLF